MLIRVSFTFIYGAPAVLIPDAGMTILVTLTLLEIWILNTFSEAATVDSCCLLLADKLAELYIVHTVRVYRTKRVNIVKFSVKIGMMPETIDVTIRWRRKAGGVELAGKFNNWIPEATERQEDGSWSRVLSLASRPLEVHVQVRSEQGVAGEQRPAVPGGQGREHQQRGVGGGQRQ